MALLPNSVERMLEIIREEKSSEPADLSARRELARIGEEQALEVLGRISRSPAIRKTLSAYILFMVRKYAEPRTPERRSPQPAYSQESVNFLGSPSHGFPGTGVDSSSSAVTPNQPIMSTTRPIYGAMPNQPVIRTTPLPRMQLFEEPAGAVTPRQQLVGSMPITVLEALGEMEFRKAFLVLSYVGRKKVDDIISVDSIMNLNCLPMVHFEWKLWEIVRNKGCISETDRRKNLDWDTKKTYVYHCLVDPDGTFSFKGPYIQDKSTHLHRVLGDENVLLVKFASEGDHLDYYPLYHKIAEEGIILGLRRYRFFVFKDGGKEEKTKCPTSSPVKCYFVRTESQWAMDMSKNYILCKKSMNEARSIFMHVHTVSSLDKYMARFSLLLSKTVKLDIDYTTVNVERIEDIFCMDEDGECVYNEDGELMIHTDGTGFISEDLANRCPLKIGKGAYMTPRNFQNVLDGFKIMDRDPSGLPCLPLDIEPPLLMQVRLFYNGTAAKGTLLIDKRLPPNTIQIRPSMRKVEEDPNCLAVSDCNSLEIVGTSNLPRRPHLSKLIIALLHHGGVPEDYFLELTKIAIAEAQNARKSNKAALRVALSHGNMDDFLLARMIVSRIPLDEPYMEHTLSIMMREEWKGLKAGKIPVHECYTLMGTADPTGRLQPDEVCIILGNGQVSGKVLVYKHPGLHFGDIHVLNAVYVKDIENIVGNAKYAIFFPTKGRRSLADEMANSDFDGDIYWVSRNPKLLEHFKPSKPWNWKYPKPKAPRPKKPTDFPSADLERALFQKFLDNRFNPSYTMSDASDSWMAYMDRLLTSCVSPLEKQRLREKILKLVDIYYHALDAPKKGSKVQVPDDLKSEKYPHFLERSNKPSYHSSSILGAIYDKVTSSQLEEPQIIDVQLLPCFSEEVPQHVLKLWSERYEEYRKEMQIALSAELKQLAIKQVVQKYKRMLYEAEEFTESKKPQVDIFMEALAIYQVAYNYISSKEHMTAGSCGVVWKIAGSALCALYTKKQEEPTIECSVSFLLELIGGGYNPCRNKGLLPVVNYDL